MEPMSEMPDQKPSLAYMRFLRLADAVRRMPAMPLLDAIEERLLNVLAEAWQSGRPLPVTEAVRRVHGVSERTAFRRLKSLQTKGLLLTIQDPQDARVHHLRPSPQAQDYFDKLGLCIEQLSPRGLGSGRSP